MPKDADSNVLSDDSAVLNILQKRKRMTQNLWLGLVLCSNILFSLLIYRLILKFHLKTLHFYSLNHLGLFVFLLHF